MYSIYKNMSRSVIIHFFLQRILIFRVRRDGYFHWFSSTIIQEETGVLFEKALFHFFVQFAVCLFLIIIPQSTTQGSRPENFCQVFGFFEPIFDSFFFGRDKIISLAVQRGQRQGYQTKCFLFFLVNFLCFSDFFCFVWILQFFYKCLPSVSLGPWFESQALPDLWSPRVWFTFRNLKSFVLIQNGTWLIKIGQIGQNFGQKQPKFGATPPRKDRERWRRGKKCFVERNFRSFLLRHS